MHNASTCINTPSPPPYQALLGRQPSLLPPFEGGYFGDLDAKGRNNSARVREIAAIAVSEAIAKARLQRGDYHKQVAAQECSELQQ